MTSYQDVTCGSHFEEIVGVGATVFMEKFFLSGGVKFTLFSKVKWLVVISLGGIVVLQFFKDLADIYSKARGELEQKWRDLAVY